MSALSDRRTKFTVGKLDFPINNSNIYPKCYCLLPSRKLAEFVTNSIRTDGFLYGPKVRKSGSCARASTLFGERERPIQWRGRVVSWQGPRPPIFSITNLLAFFGKPSPQSLRFLSCEKVKKKTLILLLHNTYHIPLLRGVGWLSIQKQKKRPPKNDRINSINVRGINQRL